EWHRVSIKRHCRERGIKAVGKKSRSLVGLRRRQRREVAHRPIAPDDGGSFYAIDVANGGSCSDADVHLFTTRLILKGAEVLSSSGARRCFLFAGRAPKPAKKPREGDVPHFVEVGEASIAVDHAMRRQLLLQRYS